MTGYRLTEKAVERSAKTARIVLGTPQLPQGRRHRRESVITYEFARAVLAEDLESSGTATAYIQFWDEHNELWCTTDNEITVMDGLGLGETLAECSPVYVLQHVQSGLWLVIAAPCDEVCACNLTYEDGRCIALETGGPLTMECAP